MSEDRYHYSHIVPGPSLPDEAAETIWQITKLVGDARNQLDPQPIIDRLADDAVYEAQEVTNPIIGKKALSEYLTERFQFFRNVRDSSDRDIGRLHPATVNLPEAANHPCLIFEADGLRRALWVVTPNAEGFIKRIDILTVAPRPSEATLI